MTSPTGNVNTNSPMLLNGDSSHGSTTTNAESNVAVCKDMATSPIQDINTSEQNQSTPSNDGNLNEDLMNASLDTAQNIDIHVVSNGDSTLSIVVSSSVSAPESLSPNSTNNKVNLLKTNH